MNSATTRGRPRRLAFELKRVLLYSDILLFAVLCVVAICYGPRNPIWICGLGIVGPCFILWMVARRQLGSSFMIQPAARELVTIGLYRRFRHPIYLFGGLATLGALLALQNWYLLLFWLAYATPIQWARLRKEDAVLQAEFGEKFLQLRSQTWI